MSPSAFVPYLVKNEFRVVQSGFLWFAYRVIIHFHSFSTWYQYFVLSVWMFLDCLVRSFFFPISILKTLWCVTTVSPDNSF